MNILNINTFTNHGLNVLTGRYSNDEVFFNLINRTLIGGNVRIIHATWSPEFAQDVSAFRNIDAEAELTRILSEQIAGEIDGHIIQQIRHSLDIRPFEERTLPSWRLRLPIHDRFIDTKIKLLGDILHIPPLFID